MSCHLSKFDCSPKAKLKKTLFRKIQNNLDNLEIVSPYTWELGQTNFPCAKTGTRSTACGPEAGDDISCQFLLWSVVFEGHLSCYKRC